MDDSMPEVTFDVSGADDYWIARFKARFPSGRGIGTIGWVGCGTSARDAARVALAYAIVTGRDSLSDAERTELERLREAFADG